MNFFFGIDSESRALENNQLLQFTRVIIIIFLSLYMRICKYPRCSTCAQLLVGQCQQPSFSELSLGGPGRNSGN